MAGDTMSKSFVKFLPAEDVGEELAGWWILSVDHDGDDGCYRKILEKTIQ